MILKGDIDSKHKGGMLTQWLKGSLYMLHMDVDDVWLPGRYRNLVNARSLLCYWAVRELSVSMASMARRLDISAVAVSKSVIRGSTLVKENGYRLFD
jgi:putative transposase